MGWRINENLFSWESRVQMESMIKTADGKT